MTTCFGHSTETCSHQGKIYIKWYMFVLTGTKILFCCLLPYRVLCFRCFYSTDDKVLMIFVIDWRSLYICIYIYIYIVPTQLLFYWLLNYVVTKLVASCWNLINEVRFSLNYIGICFRWETIKQHRNNANFKDIRKVTMQYLCCSLCRILWLRKFCEMDG
jgi:hypothetical protein